VAFMGGSRVAKLMGGRPADEALTRLVHEVSAKSGMVPPAVFEVPTDEPNAFAAGLRQADMTVAVTSGLRRALTTTELKAVVAHELGHIRAHDVSRNMHLAAVVAGLGGVYEAGRIMLKRPKKKSGKSEKGDGAVVGLTLVVGGLAAKLSGQALRCASSRRAEFKADLMGAQLYGASAMASALRKIDALAHSQHGKPRDSLGARGSAFAHAYISNPGLRGDVAGGPRRAWWEKLLGIFDTHPRVDERIAAINDAMA